MVKYAIYTLNLYIDKKVSDCCVDPHAPTVWEKVLKKHNFIKDKIGRYTMYILNGMYCGN